MSLVSRISEGWSDFPQTQKEDSNTEGCCAKGSSQREGRVRCICYAADEWRVESCWNTPRPVEIIIFSPGLSAMPDKASRSRSARSCSAHRTAGEREKTGKDRKCQKPFHWGSLFSSVYRCQPFPLIWCGSQLCRRLNRNFFLRLLIVFFVIFETSGSFLA